MSLWENGALNELPNNGNVWGWCSFLRPRQTYPGIFESAPFSFRIKPIPGSEIVESAELRKREHEKKREELPFLPPRPPHYQRTWNRLHVSGESGIQIRNFLNPLSRMEIFETEIVSTLNPDIFLFSDVTRSSPVLYREYCIQDGNLVPRFSQGRLRCKFRALYDACCVANIPKGVLGTRVNPDTYRMRVDGQIRFEKGYVWTWKFLNPERKSCGFQNMRIRVDWAWIILLLFCFVWFLLCFTILPPHHHHHLPNCTEVCRSHKLGKSVYNAMGKNFKRSPSVD